MKQILFWKYADIAGQALMLLPLIFIVSPEKRGLTFYAYFTVGAWQAISCTLTAFFGNKPGDGRRLYNNVLAWLLGIFAVCVLIFLYAHSWSDNGCRTHSGAINWESFGELFGGIAFIEAVIMLVGGPFMAIWYATITMDEIQELRKAIHHRSEIHWKL